MFKEKLIYLYILIHLMFPILGFRVWPFTDYPMFGLSFSKKDKFSVYKVKTRMIDSQEWRELRDNSFGPESFNLRSLIREENDVALEEYLMAILKRKEAKKIRVIKCYVERVKEEYRVGQETIYEISID